MESFIEIGPSVWAVEMTHTHTHAQTDRQTDRHTHTHTLLLLLLACPSGSTMTMAAITLGRDDVCAGGSSGQSWPGTVDDSAGMGW